MTKQYLAADGVYVSHAGDLWDHPDKNGWVNGPSGKKAYQLVVCPNCGEMAVVMPPMVGGGCSCGFCDTQTRAEEMK